MRKIVVAIIGIVISMMSFAVPTVTDVTAKQRYPWNGKVDITYNVTGNIAAGLPEWNRPVLMVSALDRTTGSNYVAQVSALSGDTGIEEGEHHIVWDLNAQNLEVKSNGMVFTVAYGIPLYCVIDLSGGGGKRDIVSNNLS